MRPSLVVKVKGGHGEGTGSEFHYGKIFLLVKKKKRKNKDTLHFINSIYIIEEARYHAQCAFGNLSPWLGVIGNVV